MATDIDSDQITDLRELALNLADHEAEVEHVREQLYAAIAAAHEAGVTWQQIVEATGLSKPRVYQVLARQGAKAKGSST